MRIQGWVYRFDKHLSKCSVWFILTLTLAFSSILLIFSDTPLTYGRVTAALDFLSHSSSFIFSRHLPLDLRAVWFMKLLGYPFIFSTLLMRTSSSACDTASEDNFIARSKSVVTTDCLCTNGWCDKSRYLSACVFFLYTVVSTDPSWLCFKSKSRKCTIMMDTTVYRKKTHADKYLDFTSHHPLVQIQSVVTTLLEWAMKLSSDAVSRAEEEIRIKMNGYPRSFINHTARRSSGKCQKKMNEDECERKPKATVTLPYVRGVSENIKRMLEKVSVRVRMNHTVHLDKCSSNVNTQHWIITRLGWYTQCLAEIAHKHI